ncbi:putative sensor with HAMP domain containing protein [Actinobacteria bacterium OK074]|nr:putative sensor with HAMP domain containing protein [Actinobacteria bacterium OK074]
MSGPEPMAPPPPSGSRLSPRNWRVPTRLNAILLIPVIVGLVMGGFQVKGSIDTWQEARDAEKVAKIVAAASDYAEALLNERDVSAAPLLEGKTTSTVVKQARAVTDQKADAFRAAVVGMPAKQGLERRLKLVEDAEPQIDAVRKKAFTTSMDPVKTEEGYVNVEHLLMEFSNELGLGTGNVTSYGRTVYALALAKGAESLDRAIGMHLLIRPSTDKTVHTQQVTAFTSYAYLENVALQEYVSGGTEDDEARLKTVMAEQTAAGVKAATEAKDKAAAAGQTYVAPPTLDKMIAAIGTGASAATLAQQGITPTTFMAAATLKFEGYSKVENELIDKAVNEAASIASDAQRDAFINGGIVVISLLAAFIIAGIMARQMSRSMRQLRNAAFGVAEQRLPMLVDQLSRTDPGRVDTRVAPIPINTRDEIGEVARAFDQVHREAVRLAAEQALLRGNINAIFTNLSRRNQSLIEGQLTLITDLENNEADPDQLENLFRLDHLATRMRRNGENLLVLSGEEPGRRWDQPVPLVDVLRAASSEVEQYERIELSGVPEAEIHGRAVTDLVHLLAELLENATTFSSPQTKVRVTATRLPDGRVMVEIHDKGIGLTAEDFADINQRLANPPTVDVAISQRMGLFVVGRLSDRHGIRVQLRPSGEQAGTTSLVMLPDAITHGGGGDTQAPREEFTVSQIVPEPTFPNAPASTPGGLPGPLQGGENFGADQPLKTAAELGFDDSRYAEVPDDIRELDPVGRSLMREERRAALGVPTPEQEQDPNAPAGSYQETPYQEQYAEATGEFPAVTGEFETPQQNGYVNGGAGYPEPGNGYDRQTAYEEPGRPAYGETYFSPNGDIQPPGGYPEPAYAEAAPENRTGVQAASTETFPAYQEPSYQDDWPQQDDYVNGGAHYRSEYAPEAESALGASAQVADVSERDRVGFDRPGPAPSAVHDLTEAGLPRRGSAGGGTQGGPAERQHVDLEQPPTAAGTAEPGGAWRSANDERWQQAAQLRKPKAGGVTSSGLPRRVPKANLMEGAAEPAPQGGPQVSRAPEDVRGRLSNLRQGVQRGRNAGSDTNGQATRNHHHSGPDSTYNQER